jgi:hypothetical protein
MLILFFPGVLQVKPTSTITIKSLQLCISFNLSLNSLGYHLIIYYQIYHHRHCKMCMIKFNYLNQNPVDVAGITIIQTNVMQLDTRRPHSARDNL